MSLTEESAEFQLELTVEFGKVKDFSLLLSWIAASIASAQAALMALSDPIVPQVTNIDYSDAFGCGKCLGFGTASKYIVGGAAAAYKTRDDGASIAIAGT